MQSGLISNMKSKTSKQNLKVKIESYDRASITAYLG